MRVHAHFKFAMCIFKFKKMHMAKTAPALVTVAVVVFGEWLSDVFQDICFQPGASRAQLSQLSANVKSEHLTCLIGTILEEPSAGARPTTRGQGRNFD